MSDDQNREPFAKPLPPTPPTQEELDEKAKQEQEAQQFAAEEAAKQAASPQPITDETTFATPATGDARVTHEAMSTEDLEAMGHDQDGNPVGEAQPVEPEAPPEEEEL